jgi:UPF0755 protein
LKNRFAIPLSSNEIIFGLLLCFLTTFLVAESRWSRLHNEKAIQTDETIHLFLDDRTGLDQLTQIMVDKGLVGSATEFSWAARIFGWRYFREGHYKVDKSFSYDNFLSKLARGIQDPVSVTILPGRSKSEIVQTVFNNLQLDSLSFHQTLTDSAFLEKWDLTPKEVIGQLYPNTYSAYWTATAQAFFKKIITEFRRSVVQPNQERFNEIDKSVNEILTLASIVEWEAQNEDEKATISGLYWNRLNRGMRLQADPTVNFAVGERRRLLYEDYKIDHPYNTYRYRGLPPGPITNPSLSSINAALYPEEHEYLYMVATPEGSHAFSKTFEEHKRKSAKWREWLQEQYRIKRQREQNSE